MSTHSNIEEKLRDPDYRRAFVASQINIGIPFQIRSLLKSRSWTQEILAQRTGMLQPRISGLIAAGKTRPNIETLRRIAEAFDCGLMVRFVPFSELARWSEEFDPERFDVPSFAEDSFSHAPADAEWNGAGRMKFEEMTARRLSPKWFQSVESSDLVKNSGDSMLKKVVSIDRSPNVLSPSGIPSKGMEVAYFRKHSKVNLVPLTGTQK